MHWEATALGGTWIGASTILTTNDEGQIAHVIIQHRPLDALLAFSNELGIAWKAASTATGSTAPDRPDRQRQHGKVLTRPIRLTHQGCHHA